MKNKLSFLCVKSYFLRVSTCLFLFLLLICGQSAIAQKHGQARIDSLLTELPKIKIDSTKVTALARIGSEYIYINIEEGLKFGNQALTLAQKIKWQKGIALSKECIGRLLWRKGDFESALTYHREALALWLRFGNNKNIATIYLYIGQDYADAGKYSEALEYLHQGLKIARDGGLKNHLLSFHSVISWVYGILGMQAEWSEHQYALLRLAEETGDKTAYAIGSSNIAGSLRGQGRCREAIEVNKKSLLILQEVGDYANELLTYIDIGICHSLLGEYDEALKNHVKALSMGKKFKENSGIARSNENIGDVYAAQKNYIAALPYYLLAANSYVAIDDQRALSGLYTKTGDCYQKLGQFRESRRYFDLSFDICRNLNSIAEMNLYYKGIVPLDSATGNWKMAFQHYKQYIATRDSMFNEESTRKTVQTRMQYDFDKKEAVARAAQEKKDAIARQALQQQKLIRNGFMGGFAVVMFFAGIFFYQRNRIKKGKQRSDELLLNILPAEVAEELKAKGSADAKLIDEVSVLFSDFKGFTQLSETLTPRELVAEINACFSAFDHIMQKYGVEKIKTVGDAYMAAGGLPTPNTTHAADVLHAALDMVAFMKERQLQRVAEGKFFFEARIGVHTGSVVAGIVGIKKFAYDIWGDTVNTAQRMESASEAGKINISSHTYALVKEQFHCTYRGMVSAKGKGDVEMYFVEG